MQFLAFVFITALFLGIAPDLKPLYQLVAFMCYTCILPFVDRFF